MPDDPTITAPDVPADPLASYQWSVARMNQATVFFKRALVTLVVIIAVIGLAFQLWDNINLRGSIASLRSQQAAYHTDTLARDAANQCEAQGYNMLMTELTKAQTAVSKHQKVPPFVYPPPC